MPTAHKSARGGEGSVGQRVLRLDGLPKLTGEAVYGDDGAPSDALWLRAIRSPHAHARFVIGDLASFYSSHPGIARVFAAADVPGENSFGVYANLKDQPVFAEGFVRYRGEAVLAVVGTLEAVEQLNAADVPIAWEPLPALHGTEAALADGALALHTDKPDNVLTTGLVESGRPGRCMQHRAACGGRHLRNVIRRACLHRAGSGICQARGRPYGGPCLHPGPHDGPRRGCARPGPAAGAGPHCSDSLRRRLRRQARRLPAAHAGGRSLASRSAGAVRVRAHRVDGLHHQAPPGAHLGAGQLRPRWPARQLRDGRRLQHRRLCLLGPDRGRTRAGACDGTLSGPPRAQPCARHLHQRHTCRCVPRVRRAAGGHCPRNAARRSCGAGRHRPVGISPPQRAAGGRRDGLRTGAGSQCRSRRLPRCPAAALARPGGDADAFNARARSTRRGVGIGCMWYGIGNTALSNPSTMRLTLARDGRLVFWNGAVDIGQGSTTVLTQIAADALGLPVSAFELVVGDTDLTLDAGKTSASRQTFVSGKAAQLAGEALRAKILRLTNAGPGARISLDGARLGVSDGGSADRGGPRALARPGRWHCAGRYWHLRSADHAARRQGPGRTLCHLRFCRPDCLRRCRSRPRHREGAHHRGRARCRPHHQSRRWSKARFTAASRRD